ncbi:hypothetical protein B0I32_1491 [Nonomuraea fuscirosea]|uniref:Uncharacterized protein n=1 Tax=Nonomuraea fuscirosea TaxID=1291556 RepID=A0A2T0LNQ9_9ACTN|nr:hypothetical protein [Nonomuraea fuscirosea]PRX44873.1 hypothetical protein B0I32_1491 [Nonomuraea fuscirosea]
MRFPIDTSQLAFTVTSPPMAAKDFATKKVKVTEDGQPVMVVKLLAMDGTDSTTIKFNMPGEQHHLTPGMPVRVEGLAYGMAKDGDVRWWTAAAVVPMHAAGTAASPGAGPAAGRNPHASAAAAAGSARHSTARPGEGEG